MQSDVTVTETMLIDDHNSAQQKRNTWSHPYDVISHKRRYFVALPLHSIKIIMASINRNSYLNRLSSLHFVCTLYCTHFRRNLKLDNRMKSLVKISKIRNRCRRIYGPVWRNNCIARFRFTVMRVALYSNCKFWHQSDGFPLISIECISLFQVWSQKVVRVV